MSIDKIFIPGFYVKEQETQYGTFIKLDIDIQELNDFAITHAATSGNGKKKLYIDIMTSQASGKKYACLNTWKPDPGKRKAPAEEDKPLVESKAEEFDDDDIPF